MKKIVVISDTHGNFSAIDKLLSIINESDYLFHLGDFSRDIESYNQWEIKAKIINVKGNCDGGGEDEIVEIDGVKILLTHGDRYGVKSSLTNLYLHAKEIGVSVVFYGHTHYPSIDEYEDILLINPGCMKLYSENTYCYVIIYNGEITAKIVKI